MQFSQQDNDFSKFLISHLLNDFIPKWEDWVKGLEDENTADLHNSIIRLLKGQIKAWRLWLIRNGD